MGGLAVGGGTRVADVVRSGDELHVFADGRHRVLALFDVIAQSSGGDASTGRLTALGHESTRGQTPRNFTLDLAGRYLYAANQRTDNVVAYRVDADTGLLSPTGQEFAIPTPVLVLPICLL